MEDPVATGSQSPGAGSVSVSLLADGSTESLEQASRDEPRSRARFPLLALAALCGGAGGALVALGGVVAGGLIAGVAAPVGALAFALPRWNRTSFQHEALHADLWSQGIELTLRNGDVHGLSWDDPRLALDLYIRPGKRTSESEHLLVWKSDRTVRPLRISGQGARELTRAAQDHGLTIREVRWGRAGRETRAIEFLPATAPSAGPGAELGA